MPMDFRWGCQDLTDPKLREALESLVDRYQAGESITMASVPVGIWNALALRHYLKSKVVREKDENGVVYPVMVAVPTGKALAIWHDPKDPNSRCRACR